MFPFDKKKYKDFLGFAESKNNYTIKNSIGALGKYQFMPGTLNALQSIYNLPAWKNESAFLSNPELQELYIDALINDSLNYINSNGLKKYLNIPVSGSMRFKNLTARLNIYGMLAAIHLSGSTALKNFLESGINPNDGFTSLSDYASFFSSSLPGFSNAFVYLLAFMPAIVLYYIK